MSSGTGNTNILAPKDKSGTIALTSDILDSNPGAFVVKANTQVSATNTFKLVPLAMSGTSNYTLSSNGYITIPATGWYLVNLNIPIHSNSAMTVNYPTVWSLQWYKWVPSTSSEAMWGPTISHSQSPVNPSGNALIWYDTFSFSYLGYANQGESIGIKLRDSNLTQAVAQSSGQVRICRIK